MSNVMHTPPRTVDFRMAPQLLCFALMIVGFATAGSTSSATAQEPATIATIAGDGRSSYGGDGGPAVDASLGKPNRVVADATGSLYIADTENFRIRKVDLSGRISTIAGNGVYGYSGDGGPATEASLAEPRGVTVDPAGNLYIADSGNHRIRKVSVSGVITTVAGRGGCSFLGDGGTAAFAFLCYPTDVELDSVGRLFVADTFNGRIRTVDTSGVIRTLAGSGQTGFSGDGGPATDASLFYPTGIALGSGGTVLIADTENYRIRRVDPTGIIDTVAGNGQYGFLGDGGPATSASLIFPWDVALDATGEMYIADTGSHRIRHVDEQGIISTYAGAGAPQGPVFSVAWYLSPIPVPGALFGDGGSADHAILNSPYSASFDRDGNLLIADTYNNRVRRVAIQG